MNTTIDILTGIGGGAMVLWAFLWTFIRWQRIVKNREAVRQIKNVWWGLLFIGVGFLIASLIVFMQSR